MSFLPRTYLDTTEAATPMTDAKAAPLIPHTGINMKFSRTLTPAVKMELYKKVSHTEKDEVILIFRSREMPEDFDFTRNQTIQLVIGHYEGIRVSAKGLRMLDGVVGCYVLSGSTVACKEADILYQTDDYAICQIPMSETTKKRDNKALISQRYLSLYDTVILSARDLYVGKVVK